MNKLVFALFLVFICCKTGTHQAEENAEVHYSSTKDNRAIRKVHIVSLKNTSLKKTIASIIRKDTLCDNTLRVVIFEHNGVVTCTQLFKNHFLQTAKPLYMQKIGKEACYFLFKNTDMLHKYFKLSNKSTYLKGLVTEEIPFYNFSSWSLYAENEIDFTVVKQTIVACF
ncbi:MAG: hypothetical protein OIF50_13375 [Flavobacteriaceae bacterium]|nr:hypothetical protein [Flavobacteriaceae bacterium]